MAAALEVSLNELVHGPQNEKARVQIMDNELFRKTEAIQNIGDETKAVVDNFLGLVIRDFQARKAYSG